MEWQQIASAQLAGQIDRVLNKVMHYYGPEGQKYAEKQMKIADLVVGTELGKLMELIHVTPRPVQRDRRKANSVLYGDFALPDIRKGRRTERRTDIM